MPPMTTTPVLVHRGSRRRKLILGIVLLVGSAVLVMGVLLVLEGLGLIPVSPRSEVRGDFRITHRTYDAFGHRGTRSAIHRRGVPRDRLVSMAGDFVIRDKEPRLLIYQNSLGCPDSTESCGTYYYDDRNGRSSRIGSPRLGITPLDEPETWSRSYVTGVHGSYLALAQLDDEAVILDLEAGTAFDVHRMFVLQAPAGKGEVYRPRIRFGPWSPDGRRVCGKQGAAAVELSDNGRCVNHPA